MPKHSHIDPFWHRSIMTGQSALGPWLRNQGSLTQRIQHCCSNFDVRKLQSGRGPIAYNESFLLGIAPQQLAYQRDVLLYADHQPVVFAHSVCGLASLRGAWAAVAELGNQPLGALLFAHPLVTRLPIHYKLLHNNHPLYRYAVTTIDQPPSTLWARRSLFILQHQPLLVTEVFLPGILQLDL
jgi:chorismate--pyruvate lyase